MIPDDYAAPNSYRPFDADLAPPLTKEDRLVRKHLNRAAVDNILSAPERPHHPTLAAHLECQWTRESYMRLAQSHGTLSLEEIRPDPAQPPRTPTRHSPDPYDLIVSGPFFNALLALWERDLLARLRPLDLRENGSITVMIYPDPLSCEYHTWLRFLPVERSLAETTKAFFLTYDTHGRPMFAPGTLHDSIHRLSLSLLEVAMPHWQPFDNPRIHYDPAMIEWKPLDEPGQWERTCRIQPADGPIQARSTFRPAPSPSPLPPATPPAPAAALDPTATPAAPDAERHTSRPFTADPRLAPLTETDTHWLTTLNDQTLLLHSRDMVDRVTAHTHPDDPHERIWRIDAYPHLIRDPDGVIAIAERRLPPDLRPEPKPDPALTATMENATDAALTHLLLALERDHLHRYENIALVKTETRIRYLYTVEHQFRMIHRPGRIDPPHHLPIAAQPGITYARTGDSDLSLRWIRLDDAMRDTTGTLIHYLFPHWHPLDDDRPDPRRALLTWTWTGRPLDWTRTVELVSPDYIL